MTTSKPKNIKRLYFLGLLGLIPAAGAFACLGVLIYGLFVYKDRGLSVIGGAGMVLSIGIFMRLREAEPLRTGWAKISEVQLNTLIKSIEYYKLKHGQYPDDLEQLAKDDEMLAIKDPVFAFKASINDNYIYKTKGATYTVYSVGSDCTPNTPDDFYPSDAISDTTRTGFRRFK